MNLLSWYSFRKRETLLLELTPPASVNKSPLDTEQLFRVLHGTMNGQSIIHRAIGRGSIMSFEIVSTKEQGIRYVLQVERRSASSIRQAIISYLPEVKISDATDYLTLNKNYKVVSFKQTGHYAFPIAMPEAIDRLDPVSYVTGAMSNLEQNEMVTLQYLIRPVKIYEAKKLSAKILVNHDLLTHLQHRRHKVLQKVLYAINSLLFSILDGFGSITSVPTNTVNTAKQRDEYERVQIAKRLKPARVMSGFEQELIAPMQAKLSQPLFRVTLQALISSGPKVTSEQKVRSISTALAAYDVPHYQSIRVARRLIPQFKADLVKRMPRKRTKNEMVISASELASLYHFPLTRSSRSDNLQTSLSRTLPAPITLKGVTKPAIILGKNVHHGTETLIGLSEQERERHVYIIGGTGNGKTTMLQYGIIQDMENGNGLAVIDPHGDMAQTILEHVPKDRMKDVIYFNPDDLLFPIGLNLLEIKPGLEGAEIMREKDLITESVISVFRKIFSEEGSGGHRIEYVLRNTVQTALTMPDATLFTIFSLLNDPKFRRAAIKNLDNQDLKNFWKNELGKAGEFQRVKMAAGITSKIGRFLFSASAKQILEQPKSTIDFDKILNDGKILICNVSKGLVGEDTSELFGITILAKLQLAALRRARLPQADRRPFYLYVDEFQNFATTSFVQLLSEARKYKLFLLMAEQSTSQQDDQQMVSVILANVGTVICFRTGNPQDERLLLPLFSPYINEGEISNLPAYNYYAKLSAILPQEPMSGITLLLKRAGSASMALNVIEFSREQYAVSKMEDSKPPIEQVLEKENKTSDIIHPSVDLLPEDL